MIEQMFAGAPLQRSSAVRATKSLFIVLFSIAAIGDLLSKNGVNLAHMYGL
jgi:hypothetical protein